MQIFKLPDLGEGLPDAEIVEWQVNEGDFIGTDEALVSMETAKAVVDVPSPYTGTVVKLHGQPGDVIDTGAPLVTFDTGETISPAVGPAANQTADHIAETTAHETVGDGSDNTVPAAPSLTIAEQHSSDVFAREDSGTVVGQMQSSNTVLQEQAVQVGQFKATPAVRATARKLKVDLSQLRGSGRNGVITLQDVKAAASSGNAVPVASSISPAPVSPVPAAGAAAPPVTASGEWTPVRGTRRTMARVMAEAHAQVVPTSITEQADLALWQGKGDLTVRLIRALVAACQQEPILNAWFNPDGPQIQIHQSVNVGIAVDTADGLFVSNLRAAEQQDAKQLRSQLDQLREHVNNRTIPPADLSGYTIVLSNVGVYAGRYTTPIITPPCVAIMAVGKMRQEAVATFAGLAAHPMLPLSLTFDHRAVTGGEAARFLGAFIEDITRAG